MDDDWAKPVALRHYIDITYQVAGLRPGGLRFDDDDVTHWTDDEISHIVRNLISAEDTDAVKLIR